jgi:hypothetical protein
MSSVVAAVTVIVLVTVALAAGAVILTIGGVVSGGRIAALKATICMTQ